MGWREVHARAGAVTVRQDVVHTPPTRSGEMLKLLRVAAEGKPAYGNFGGWHRIRPDIKRAASLPDADLALLMAETVASGVRPYVSDKAVIVHIVNLNQTGFWRASVDEITPLPAQTVKVKLPKGRGVGLVKLLVSGQEATTHVENGVATVDISSIASAHEVIVLELE